MQCIRLTLRKFKKGKVKFLWFSFRVENKTVFLQPAGFIGSRHKTKVRHVSPCKVVKTYHGGVKNTFETRPFQPKNAFWCFVAPFKTWLENLDFCHAVQNSVLKSLSWKQNAKVWFFTASWLFRFKTKTLTVNQNEKQNTKQKRISCCLQR